MSRTDHHGHYSERNLTRRYARRLKASRILSRRAAVAAAVREG